MNAYLRGGEISYIEGLCAENFTDIDEYTCSAGFSQEQMGYEFKFFKHQDKWYISDKGKGFQGLSGNIVKTIKVTDHCNKYLNAILEKCGIVI